MNYFSKEEEIMNHYPAENTYLISFEEIMQYFMIKWLQCGKS